MRRLWAKICGLLSVLSVVFLIAGCGKKQDGAGAVKKLEVYYIATPHVAVFYKEVFEKFEQNYPGVKLKLNNIPSNYYMILQTRFAGNTAPDVIYIQNKSLADYTDRGVLLNLKRYIGKDNYDISDICKLGFEEGGITEDKIYGIPVTGSPEVLIYNKDLFDQAGVSYPDETWTQKELLAAARALTRDTDGDSRIDRIGISAGVGWWAGDFPLIWAAGAEVFNKDMTRCIVASPEAEEAIQFQVDLVNKYKVTSKGTLVESEGKGGIDLFMSGRLAMLPVLPYTALTEFSKCKNLNWDLALMPEGKKARVVRYTGECWVVSKNTKYPKESWELVKLLASAETARELTKLNKIPARLSVLNSPDFIKPQTPYHEEVIVKSLKYARAIPSLRNVEKLSSVWRRYMDLAKFEKISVKECLKNIQDELNKLLSEEEK
jgi:multiple sugar transport system substrate-binding protein